VNLELFPCSGGMAEGFRRAGLTFDLAFDVDLDACDSYERNLGHRPIRIDARDLLRMAQTGMERGLGALTDGRIDLIVADPPCTPWSRAGKRLGTDDARDMLLVTVELLRLLRPRCYLIGNVPGLNDAPHWGKLQAALAPLGEAGYCIADYATLDAANYGVPQHRCRPFWFGHLSGPCITWPAPTHGDPADPAVHSPLPGLGLLPWVTCRDALGHLPPKDLGRPVRMRQRGCNGEQLGSVPDRPARVVGTTNADAPAPTIGTASDRVGSGAVVLRQPDANRPPADPDAPHRSVTASARGHTALLEWPWDQQSTTLQRDERIPPPGHHDEYSTRSMPDAVLLSERAAAILQGFPEGWHFAGKTKTSRWSQLGQAMPPPLAEAVARAVRAQMDAT
jgi:DNA (cytosine-5)-methyltransferase 1